MLELCKAQFWDHSYFSYSFNDILFDTISEVFLIINDISLMEINTDPLHIACKTNRDLERLAHWPNTWLVTFDVSKTVYMVIYHKHEHSQPSNTSLHEADCHTHLGLAVNRKSHS